ncbi:hypothetical protein [Thermococcus sp. MV5]|uniref:hypothetical protein n=1 Tax=Thermococcus sp. MV5 TaxID=1638272 RepID=UPI00143ABAD1|nr:hypothetical protein [Thermococcus sp. MV5]
MDSVAAFFIFFDVYVLQRNSILFDKLFNNLWDLLEEGLSFNTDLLPALKGEA